MLVAGSVCETSLSDSSSADSAPCSPNYYDYEECNPPIIFRTVFREWYLGDGLIGALSIIAFRKYPRLAFSALLTVALLTGGLFIPVPGSPYLTLLDRPLVEMLMFIPLAILGGLGCAGLG